MAAMTANTSDKAKPAGQHTTAGFLVDSDNSNPDSTGGCVDAHTRPTKVKPITSDFAGDFIFSATPLADAIVRRACHRHVIDCCGVTRATRAEDRAGVDYWVVTPRGRAGLDLKLRRKDYAAGRRSTMDCVVELEGHGICGWLLKPSNAQFILFACSDTHRVAIFEKRKLQTVDNLNVSRWLADGRVKEFDTVSERDGRKWRSRAVVISAELLTQAIDNLDMFGATANDRGAE